MPLANKRQSVCWQRKRIRRFGLGRVTKNSPNRSACKQYRFSVTATRTRHIEPRQGLPLLDAVKALSQNKEHPQLARGFATIASRIEGGDSLSICLLLIRSAFSLNNVAHLVSAGELRGGSCPCVTNAAEQLSYDQAIKNDVRGALTYPLVLIFSGLAAMLIIFFAGSA